MHTIVSDSYCTPCVCLAAAGVDLLQNCEELLANMLVAVYFQTDKPKVHLHHVAKLTHLTSLTLIEFPKEDDHHHCAFPAGDQITLLQSLTSLHNLRVRGFQQPNWELQGLQSLRKLALCIYTPVCDVTSCTQVTSLALTWQGYMRHSILLPAGSSVQLQLLSISAACGVSNFNVLQILQDATQLSAIAFHCSFPASLLGSPGGAWPVYMPHLKIIKADIIPGVPPQQLVGYSQLRHLDVTLFGERSLPSSFSQLTQLDTLCVESIANNGLHKFPVCLLHLKQLSSLDLKFGKFDSIELPVEILQFLQFSALKSPSLRGGLLGPTEHQQLDELRGRILEFCTMTEYPDFALLSACIPWHARLYKCPVSWSWHLVVCIDSAAHTCNIISLIIRCTTQGEKLFQDRTLFV